MWEQNNGGKSPNNTKQNKTPTSNKNRKVLKPRREEGETGACVSWICMCLGSLEEKGRNVWGNPGVREIYQMREMWNIKEMFFVYYDNIFFLEILIRCSKMLNLKKFLMWLNCRLKCYLLLRGGHRMAGMHLILPWIISIYWALSTDSRRNWVLKRFTNSF